jgi:hypothetical protein
MVHLFYTFLYPSISAFQHFSTSASQLLILAEMLTG